MDVILQHLHPILRNKQWETRMAATDAITEIMKQIKVEAREKREEVKIKAEGAVVQKFDLDSFDLESVLARSGEMKASRGEEFFEAETSAASQEDQRKALNQRLGLDMAAKLGVATDDIFSYDDLKQSASPPPTQAKASEAQGRPMSSRERNKLKRALSKQQRNTIAASKKIKMAPKLYKADRSRLESGEWPLRDFCLGLRKDLFDETWEIRHGAATAVREIVRLQGSGAGIRAGVDAVEAERSRSLWLQDMGLCLVVVIAKDRFGDFVSDQVVAPVRESCAQALGSVVDLMSEKEVQMIADILIKLLKEEDWQCRHGGLLAVSH
jgi:TATA-binding protein-associated factor